MLAVLSIVAPVFALMALGFIVARRGILPEGAGQALAQFAFKIAIPALLFRAMLTSGRIDSGLIGLLSAYFTAAAALWLLATAAVVLLLRRPAEDQAPIAMAAGFGNTVMLGLPICITAFGPEATAPLAVLIATEAVVLWIVGTLHMEFARRGSAFSLAALGRVARDLAVNPVVLSLTLGLAGRGFGLTLPEAPDRFLALMGQAGVPTALFALGMVLASFKPSGEGPALGVILALKLLIFPVLAWFLAAQIFALPPLFVALAKMQAAMPVGANAFLFASRYERGAGTVSAAIAVSTIAAVATVSAALYLLKGG